MTDHPVKRPGWKEPKPKRKPRTTQGGGSPNSKHLAEARATTANRRSAARLDANPVEVLQETLDGLVQDLRFSQKMVDMLPEDEMWRRVFSVDGADGLVENGKIPHEWIRLRDEYRDRVAALAGSMISRGIAEKAVNVRAAQAALMATMVREAMTRAGVPRELVTKTGEQLRQLAIEATGGQE